MSKRVKSPSLNPKYLAGFTIGMCFQDAMDSEDTDEGTEP